jgi:hypothetical protein
MPYGTKVEEEWIQVRHEPGDEVVEDVTFSNHPRFRPHDLL